MVRQDGPTTSCCSTVTACKGRRGIRVRIRGGVGHRALTWARSTLSPACLCVWGGGGGGGGAVLRNSTLHDAGTLGLVRLPLTHSPPNSKVNNSPPKHNSLICSACRVRQWIQQVKWHTTQESGQQDAPSSPPPPPPSPPPPPPPAGALGATAPKLLQPEVTAAAAAGAAGASSGASCCVLRARAEGSGSTSLGAAAGAAHVERSGSTSFSAQPFSLEVRELPGGSMAATAATPSDALCPAPTAAAATPSESDVCNSAIHGPLHSGQGGTQPPGLLLCLQGPLPAPSRGVLAWLPLPLQHWALAYSVKRALGGGTHGGPAARVAMEGHVR